MGNRATACQRGSATVEMMLWLPVLLTVLFGIAESSRVWLVVAEVTAAAREGARTGTQTPTSTGNVFDASLALAAIDTLLAGANLSGGASRSVTCATPCIPGSEVQATVTVTFTTAAPDLLPGLGSLTIQEVARMRYE